MADWNAIKKEYIKGGISLRKLAAKHGLNPSKLLQKSASEGWAAQRNQNRIKSESIYNAMLVGKQAEVGYTVYDAAMELLDAYKESLAAVRSGKRVLSSDMLQKYGQALKSIQGVIDGKKTDLDIEEQKARIERLRREAEDAGEQKSVVITMGGGVDDYAM